MRRTLSFAVLISLLLVGNSWARVWYVKPDSTGAVINIQAGIDSCAAGDTVVALPGVYRGDGNWDLDFKGKPIVVMSASRYDPSITDSTVIDGGGGHRGFYFHSGETNASILDGFTITNGRFCQPYAPYCGGPGGGISCDSASSPVIRYNKINNCYGNSGGGILCTGSSAPIISNNKIYQCGAWSGSAICCLGSSAPIINNNDIYGNLANDYGIGIYCGSCSPVIINNRIHDNYGWSSYSAGKIPSSLSSLITKNGTHDNAPLAWGGSGGISCWYCPSVTIGNNKLYHNYGVNGGGGVEIIFSSATIRGNDIWGNEAEGVGGLWVGASTAIIVSNSIHDNQGCYAIECDASSVTIDSNSVYGNDLEGWGGRGNSAIGIVSSKGFIRDNQITSNIAGGIIYSGDSTGTIENNIIAGNHGQPGGGINCSSPVNIIGNTIKNNVGFPGGGGIYYSSSGSIRSNVIISNNGSDGGGIYCTGRSPSIINNTIVGNKAGHGSGIYITAQSHPIVSCNIIANNQRIPGYPGPSNENEGGGIYSESDSITISYCDAYGNEGGNYIGLPDQTGTNGNFSADAVFCDAGNFNYALSINSPCAPGNHPNGSSCGLIGALGVGCEIIATTLQEYHAEGDASAVALRWRLSAVGDQAKFLVLRAQMPSTEYLEISDASITRDGLSFSFKDVNCEPGETYRYRVDLSDRANRSVLFETDPITIPAARLALQQNYPNPFNPSTAIKYYLPGKSRVTLDIYDISGKRISQLVRENEEKGFYSVEWKGLDSRGTSVASGIYFYRLTAGKETISKKMVLLK